MWGINNKKRMATKKKKSRRKSKDASIKNRKKKTIKKKAEPIKKTIPNQIHSYLRGKGIAVKKRTICKALKLKRSSVNYGCRKLRKEKKIGMYRKTYWGIIN